MIKFTQHFISDGLCASPLFKEVSLITGYFLAPNLLKKSCFIYWSHARLWNQSNKVRPTLGSKGPHHMSLITELTWWPGRFLLSVHMRNFSPVDRENIQETQTKWLNIKLVSFATAIALWTLVTFRVRAGAMLSHVSPQCADWME